MRSSTLVVTICFAYLVSATWSAESDSQTVRQSDSQAAQAKRQELIKSQQLDKPQIDHVAKLIVSYQSLTKEHSHVGCHWLVVDLMRISHGSPIRTICPA